MSRRSAPLRRRGGAGGAGGGLSAGGGARGVHRRGAWGATVSVDALRFAGEVFDAGGAPLGEARVWAAAERGANASCWCGWLNIADLARSELPTGRYRMR